MAPLPDRSCDCCPYGFGNNPTTTTETINGTQHTVLTYNLPSVDYASKCKASGAAAGCLCGTAQPEWDVEARADAPVSCYFHFPESLRGACCWGIAPSARPYDSWPEYQPPPWCLDFLLTPRAALGLELSIEERFLPYGVRMQHLGAGAVPCLDIYNASPVHDSNITQDLLLCQQQPTGVTMLNVSVQAAPAPEVPPPANYPPEPDAKKIIWLSANPGKERQLYDLMPGVMQGIAPAFGHFHLNTEADPPAFQGPAEGLVAYAAKWYAPFANVSGFELTPVVFMGPDSQGQHLDSFPDAEIEKLLDALETVNATGMHMDWEPLATNNGGAGATTMAGLRMLRRVCTATRARGLRCDFDVADWGHIDDYGVIEQANVTGLMNMGTYYGHHNEKSKTAVNSLLLRRMAAEVSDPNKIQVGIGGMHYELPAIPWRGRGCRAFIDAAGMCGTALPEGDRHVCGSDYLSSGSSKAVCCNCDSPPPGKPCLKRRGDCWEDFFHGWTAPTLRAFLAELDVVGARHITIFRGDTDSYDDEPPLRWFLEALADWQEGEFEL